MADFVMNLWEITKFEEQTVDETKYGVNYLVETYILGSNTRYLVHKYMQIKH